ncbi:GNAT family N-acetyltransferase [Pseudomonas piscis]|uniref:GNAT family N-acetyltransferase n=1 Tax=Pseudomonas piscis TaxID=2614538 RepID=UPI0021D596FC|nr:GNAT family N-acetyltransferase [Pseudomonas piscis]MCU7647047.1 GNAT family N-acetyltransferase [Pseudomonas piscis]
MRTFFDNGKSIWRTNRLQCPEALFIEAAVVVIVEVLKIRLEQYHLAEKGNAVGIRGLLKVPDNLLVVHVIRLKKALALLMYLYCIHVVRYPSSDRSNVLHSGKHAVDGQVNETKRLHSQCALVVLDRSNNQVIGSSRYYEFDEGKREVAIGYTFLARAKWGGGTNKELKDLMLTYAFQLVDTVWFHVDSQNLRSQRAMEKVGGRLSHRATRQLIDRTQEYLLYKIEKPSHSG